MKKILVIVGLCLFTAILIGSIVGTASGTIGSAIGMYKPYNASDGTGGGCRTCHGSKPGMLGQVVINGPTSVKVGTKASYTVVLVGLPLTPFGGINAAIENYGGERQGGLVAGTNTAIKEDQVTHVPGAGGKAINARIWTFDWTPSEAGSHKLFVTSLASNGDGGPNFGNGSLLSGSGTLGQVPDMWYQGQQAITVTP